MPGDYTAPAPEVDFIFACQQAVGCSRNGSRVQTHLLAFGLSGKLLSTFGMVPDIDNRLSVQTRVNRYGFPAETGCQVGTLDCLPLYVDGVPAEVQGFQYRGTAYMEMDITFQGTPSGWFLPINLR
jgi:hypothetical protein